jgi:L-asparagine oxygenase
MSESVLDGYDLSAVEVAQLEALLTELVYTDHDPGNPSFHDHAWEFVARLPWGLRDFLHGFRQNEAAAAITISGFPVDDGSVGPTPGVWSSESAARRTRREEFFVALIGNCLGEVFSWSTLQGGRMIHNVVPIQGEETEQSGHGSNTLLEWHTEDGFHPYRCDYLMLFGVRNDDRVPTTLASIRDVILSPQSAEVLAQSRFYILPDDEHLRQLAKRDPLNPSLVCVRRMREQPEPAAVLYGALDEPYLRIDPYFMRCADGDDEASAALSEIVVELNRVQRDVVVGPGALLIVDNYLAVHGRRAFSAHYDGTDRWLKKTLVTRDLRKSRSARAIAAARVLN